jgi:hypothetical protein
VKVTELPTSLRSLSQAPPRLVACLCLGNNIFLKEIHFVKKHKPFLGNGNHISSVPHTQSRKLS